MGKVESAEAHVDRLLDRVRRMYREAQRPIDPNEYHRRWVGVFASGTRARDRAITEQARQEGARLERERCAVVDPQAVACVMCGVSSGDPCVFPGFIPGPSHATRWSAAIRALPPLPPAEEKGR